MCIYAFICISLYDYVIVHMIVCIWLFCMKKETKNQPNFIFKLLFASESNFTRISFGDCWSVDGNKFMPPHGHSHTRQPRIGAGGG